MEIDIRTLSLVNSIAAVIQVIALTLQYILVKTYRGIGWWLIGFLMFALGFLFAPLVDEYEIIKSHLFNLHIKDFEHKNGTYQLSVLGNGDIPYQEIFKQMKAAHYEKYLSLEPELDREGVIQSIDFLKKFTG
jgi:sugar phosphate isomerase/epimerase